MQLCDVEVIAEGLAFPEGPVALADGSVLVVEIQAGRVSRCRPDGTVETVAETGGGPNGAAVGPDGALYVCNNGGMSRATRAQPAIQRVDLGTGAVTTVYTACADRELIAPNDLIFDATGNFWFTDLRGGALYYAAPDGSSIVAAVTDAASPNGVGLSPDGDILYWAETDRRQVHRRRLDGPGRVVAARPYTTSTVLRHGSADPWTLLAGLPGASELDSLAVDSAGSVCVGTLVEAGITEVAADGSDVVLHTLPPALADGAVTNICFGGADRRDAYLTCSQNGRLVRCRWHRPGLALPFER